LVYAIIIFITIAAAPPAIATPNQNLKISPSIRFHNPSETLKVWVLFADKGFSTASDQRRAIDQYQTAIHLKPSEPRFYLNLSKAYELAGAHTEAEKTYQEYERLTSKPTSQ